MACRGLRGIDSDPLTFPEPDVGPRYAPDRAVRIVHLDVTLDLFPVERRFDGRAIVRLLPLSTYAGEVVFDLDDVDVIEVRGPAGPLPFHSRGGTIRIASTACPEQLSIVWRGANPRLGIYFVGPNTAFPEREPTAWTQCQDEDAHYILPCHDHPRARHAWTIRLTGPTGHTLLSNGRVVSTSDDGIRASAVFEQVEPMPAYLFTAVSAPLEVHEDRVGELPIRYLVPPGTGDRVARSMGRTPDMIRLFERLLGVPFPWPRYDQVVVHDFVFGGMENVACTTMTEILLVDEDPGRAWDPETLVAHELAHQWFGDLVTCVDWSHGWLNESWATLFEVLWIEHTRSVQEATAYRMELARHYIDEAHDRYVRAIVERRFREPIDVFDRHLYEKGACVLLTLRGEIGDEAFFAGARHYLTDRRHDVGHTVDLFRAFERPTGRTFERFAAQWIEGGGHPKLKVAIARDGDRVTVDVEQTQPQDPFHLTLRVIVRTDAHSMTFDLPVTSRKASFDRLVDGVVRSVEVDPGARVLAEIDVEAPDEWVIGALASDCPAVVAHAATALARRASRPGRAALVRALSGHPDRWCRIEVARALADQFDASVEDALVDALHHEPDARARVAIVAALGSPRRGEAASRALRARLDSDPSTHVRAAASKALGHTRAVGVVDDLAPRVDVASWAEVVAESALAGLAATGRPEALDVVLPVLGADRPARRRGAAARAAGTLAGRLAGRRHEVLERLASLAHAPELRAALGAVAGLRALGVEAIPALEQRRLSGGDGRVVRAAFEAVRALRGREDLVALRERVDQVERRAGAVGDRLDRLEGRFEGSL
jgi:aminopeptidase N